MRGDVGWMDGTSNIQLLSKSTCRLGRSAGLEPDDFHQVDDPAEIVIFVLFACETLDLDGDGRVWFLRWMGQWWFSK